MALTIENTNLVISTEPEYADQLIDLTSSDESVVKPVIVSTSDSGVNTYRLEAVGAGTATLTATTPGGATSSIQVTVTESSGGSSGQDSGGSSEGGNSGSVTPDSTSTTIPVSNIYFHQPNSNTRVESLAFALNTSAMIEMAPYITVEPSDATNRGWRLSSSNSSVLSTSGASVMTVSAGQSNLTVMATDGTRLSDTVIVTVTSVPAESVSFNTSTFTLSVGDTRDLANYLTFTPSASVYSGYTVESSRPAIAKVTGSSVKAMAAGEAIITVTTNSGKTATATVIVNSSQSGGSSSNDDIPESFSISCSKTSLEVGEEATIQIVNTVPTGLDLPSSGELRLVFTNSRCYVSSPNEDGTFIIKALNSPGDETIRMSWRNDDSGWISSDPINLTIMSSGTSDEGDFSPLVTLSSVSINMNSSGKIPGDEFQANVVISPSNYSPTSVTWSSSDTTVASVTNTGYISCFGEGRVTISVDVDGTTASRTFFVGNDNGSEQNPTDWAEDDEETPLVGTNVAAGLVPFTASDKYPTHYAKYGKGGYRSVSNISERNAIPPERREEGMMAWVISESKLYRLRSGYWVEVNFGGGSSTPGSGDPDEGTQGPGDGNCRCCEELEPRIAALEAIILAQQQADLKRQLDSNPYTLNISGLHPSGSKYEVGESVENLRFNYALLGPSPIPSMQSAIINGATISSPSGSYSGGAVDSSSAGTKTLYSITVKYFDTRYAQLDQYRAAGGLLREATASKNIMFGYKIYCGKTTLDPENFTWSNLSSSTIGTESIVSGLPAKSSPLTFRYSVTRGRAWVAYPKAWGQNVDIKDSLGQSYAIDFSFKEISVPVAGNQVAYYLYYLTNASDAEDFEFNFSKK
jgi:uncharacterized protein YjdB